MFSIFSAAPLAAVPSVPLALEPVKAGFPSPAEGYAEKPLNLHDLLIEHPEATFIIRAAGDSMINYGIFSGDFLVVDRSIKPTRGDIVLAEFNREFTLKKLDIDEGGPFLVPGNPKYSILRPRSEEELIVVGVISGLARKLK